MATRPCVVFTVAKKMVNVISIYHFINACLLCRVSWVEVAFVESQSKGRGVRLMHKAPS